MSVRMMNDKLHFLCSQQSATQRINDNGGAQYAPHMFVPCFFRRDDK